MLIRCYQTNDEPAVISLWQRCNLTRPWNDPKRDIRRKLADSPELFFVGELDGSIIATVVVGYDGHRGWIYYLAVDPDMQKHGYGREIMRYAEEKLLELGCPKIDLMVRKTNSGVIGFYQSIGYTEDDVVTMSRRLIQD